MMLRSEKHSNQTKLIQAIEETEPNSYAQGIATDALRSRVLLPE